MKKYLVQLQQSRSLWGVAFKAFLHLLSIPYKLCIFLRNIGYDYGLLPTTFFDAATISVGNIAVGGVGKTPLVDALAQALSQEKKVALLSRGYRSKAEHAPQATIVSQGNGPMTSVSVAGDEPYLLAQNCPKVWVIVHANRRKAARLAIEKGCDCLILDDGFQHRALGRHKNIVVLDAKDPWAQGYCMPRGFLRESPASLRRADAVVISRCSLSPQQRSQLKAEVRRYTLAPIICTDFFPEKIVFSDGREEDIARGNKVAAFCGLGSPEQFYALLRKLGLAIVSHLTLSDHASPSFSNLQTFATKAIEQGADMLLCTQKDFVKLPLALNLPLSIAYLQVSMKVIEGHEHWNRLIQDILQHKIETEKKHAQ